MVQTVAVGVGNVLQGDFGEAWLGAVAAGCGLAHGRPHTTDLEKADVELTLLEEVGGTYHPTVKVQVKTEINLGQDVNGTFSYSLDIKTYDVLRRVNHSTSRILVVIGLEPLEPRVKLEAGGTLLIGQGAWVSLEGMPASANASSQVVKLPSTNTLDHEGLRRMLTTHGVRNSTQVPTPDLWATNPASSTEGTGDDRR